MYKNLPTLAIVTLIFVVAACYSVYQRSSNTVVAKDLLYPDLAEQIQDVVRMELKTHKDTTVLAVKDNQWVLENRGGYPAKFDRIKPLAIALSELQIREAKTANSVLFPRLDVEDVTTEKAKSKQIVLQNSEGKVLASLLIGKQRVNRADGSTDSLYVRKSDEQQSYLVKGDINLTADPMEWLENSLFDLSSDRLKSITIKNAGDELVQAVRSAKGSEDYELQNIPEGFKVRSQTTVNSMASAVEELHFDDVNNEKNFEFPSDVLITEYQTFDGMLVTVKSTKKDDQVWAVFSFAFNGTEEAPDSADEVAKNSKPSVQQQVALLNEKTKGWVYLLPNYKGKMLSRKFSELIIEVGAEPAHTEVKSSVPGIDQMDLPPGLTPEMLKGLKPPSGIAAPQN